MNHSKTTTASDRKQGNRRGVLKRVLSIGLLAILITISSLFQNVIIGEAAIGIYGLVAVFFRIPSATTFKMVFVTLIAIPIITMLRPDSELEETFAVYAYLLIAVGILCAVLEYWRNTKKEKIK